MDKNLGISSSKGKLGIQDILKEAREAKNKQDLNKILENHGKSTPQEKIDALRTIEGGERFFTPNYDNLSPELKLKLHLSLFLQIDWEKRELYEVLKKHKAGKPA